MKGDCEGCNKPATTHLTEIKGGKKIEQHLCEGCPKLKQHGVPVKPHTPLNELLTQFVMKQSGMEKSKAGGACEVCGMTWAEFRQAGLFGCEHDYAQFADELEPMLQRAHEGGTHHVGKSPSRRGSTSRPLKRQLDLARLRKELAACVEGEDYERAAELRDKIRAAEGE